MSNTEIWTRDGKEVEVPLPPPELKELGVGMYQITVAALKQEGWRRSAFDKGPRALSSAKGSGSKGRLAAKESEGANSNG